MGNPFFGGKIYNRSQKQEKNSKGRAKRAMNGSLKTPEWILKCVSPLKNEGNEHERVPEIFMRTNNKRWGIMPHLSIIPLGFGVFLFTL